MGIKLPNDYVECIKENNGGRPRPKTFDFGGNKEMIFASLLSLAEVDKENISAVYDWIKDRLPQGVYPFAKDPFGNFICFKYEEESISIVFWDHEKTSEDREKSIETICETFQQLLDKLY